MRKNPSFDTIGWARYPDRLSHCTPRSTTDKSVPRQTIRVPVFSGPRITCLQTMTIDYLKKILTARVYDVASETPLELAPQLSKRFENRIYFKREDVQDVFSFKIRRP